METEQLSPSQSVNVESLREAGRKLSSTVEELSPDVFLTGAAASVAISLFLRITGRQHDAQFVGQWAPTLLLLGLYTRQGRRSQAYPRGFESREDVPGRDVH